MAAIILDLGSDIKGDCMLEGYVDKIEAISLSQGVAMQLTSDLSNGERTIGKAYASELTLTKYVDSASPSLNGFACMGKPLKEVKVILGRNAAGDDGKILPYYIYTLSNVLFSSVHTNGGTGGKPIETLSMNFTKIEWEFTKQGSDGSKKGTTAFTHELFSNARKA